MDSQQTMLFSSTFGAKWGSELRGVISNLNTEKNIALLIAAIVATVVIVIDTSAAVTLMMIARLLLIMAGLHKTYAWL